MNIVRWFVALLLCAASPLHAVTINFLSDSRSVDTRATAGSSNGSATMPDAQIAAPFQTFSGGASSTMAWPDAVDPQFFNAAFASASQTSALLPDGFSISTSLTAAVQGSARQTPRSQSKASASSQVAITFTVSEPVMFELVYSEAHDSQLGDLALYQSFGFLNSDRSGRMLSVPPEESFSPVLSGLLVPGDVYTFSYFQRVGLVTPDPSGHAITASSNVRLDVRQVPDQAGVLSFAIACACLGLTQFFGRAPLLNPPR